MLHPPRVCLDLNVLVRRELALLAGKPDNVARRLFDACVLGQCDLIISRAMTDRFGQVLERRVGYPATEARLRAERVQMVSRLANLIVVGGGIAPMNDLEDQGVLETALAGGAHYLATYNIHDFEPAATRDVTTGRLRVRELHIVTPDELLAILHEPV